jgi:hypothetical protein
LEQDRAHDAADVNDIVPGDDCTTGRGDGGPLKALHGQLSLLSMAEPAHKGAAVLCPLLVFTANNKPELREPVLLP